MCTCAKSLQLCSTLCKPVDCSPLGSSVHGILQVRILDWIAMPFSRGSPQLRNQTHISYVSCIGMWVLYQANVTGRRSQQLGNMALKTISHIYPQMVVNATLYPEPHILLQPASHIPLQLKPHILFSFTMNVFFFSLKASPKILEEETAYSNTQPPMQGYWNGGSGKHDNTKGAKLTPITNLKEIEIYKMPNKEFNIVMLNKLSKLPNNTDRPLSKIWKTICDQNEKSNTEMGTIQKNQTEILEPKIQLH